MRRANQRAARVFLFTRGYVITLQQRNSIGPGLLRNNRSLRGRPLNPYVVPTPSRFPKGRGRAMKSTRTTTVGVRCWAKATRRPPRVTFVKGLPASASLALSFDLLLLRDVRAGESRRVPNYRGGRRLIASLLLPVNSSRSTLLN